MLISVHTPKTAGSSFMEVLSNHYRRSLLTDYSDIPLNKDEFERLKDAVEFDSRFNYFKKAKLNIKGVKCIHGHFLPFKYRGYLGKPQAKFITWLRDPIERLVSHYFYWRNNYSKYSAPLHQKVVKENWSLEAFCFSKEMQNVYTKIFWKFPIENFDFIGIQEFFRDDLYYFTEKYFGNRIENIPQKNITKNNEILQGFPYEKLQQFHSEDYTLYKKALELRDKRISNIHRN